MHMSPYQSSLFQSVWLQLRCLLTGFLPGLTSSFALSPAYVSTILTSLFSKSCQHVAGLSWDERQWRRALEFINRVVSLKVNQCWAIKLSVRKLSELCSLANERCVKDVLRERKSRRLMALKYCSCG